MSYKRQISRGTGAASAQNPASDEAGSILILVALSMAVLIGMVGLAIDVAQLYVAQQQAQTAADAAAITGILDAYNADDHGVITYGPIYGQMNDPSVTIHITAPNCSQSWCSGHVLPAALSTFDFIQAVATKTVNTTFLSVLGITSSTVTATADAGIVLGPQRIPMVALQPTQSPSLNVTGTLTICGGPPTALDVNTQSASSISVGSGALIDLSHAGPLDPGDCSAGTGASLANAGSQSVNQLGSGTVNLGTLPGVYTPNATPKPDPFQQIATLQNQPGAAPASQNFPGSNSYYSCPTACTVWFPGDYPSGILVTSGFNVFTPGIYYLDTGGFQVGAGSIVRTATGAPPDPVTGSGMLIYNVGASVNDILNIQPGSGAIGGNPYGGFADCPLGGNCLTGVPATAQQNPGILFFQDFRTALNLVHYVDTGSGLTLSGVLYITHKISDGTYQTLNVTGAITCGTTGSIIADVINISGCVTVNLGQQLYLAPGVALIR